MAPVRFSHLSSYKIHLAEQTEYSSSAGYQNSLPSTFFTGLEQKISQFIQKHKRPQITKAVLRKKTGAGGINLPDYRLYYKASHLLAQKQKHRPMEQDRKPSNKPTHLWVPYFSQRRQEYTMGQRQPL